MTPGQAQQAARRLVRQLIDERESRGLSLLEMAREAGLDPSGVADNEQGRSLPRLTTIIRLADALGWDVRLVERADEGVVP